MKTFWAGLARLDVVQPDALGLRPRPDGAGEKLGAVIHPERGRRAVERDQFLEEREHAPTRQRHPDLDRQGLPVAVVEHVEGPEDAPVVERVPHEVQHPGLIQHGWRAQRHAGPPGHPPAGAAGPVEPQGAVDPVHALWFQALPSRRRRS